MIKLRLDYLSKKIALYRLGGDYRLGTEKDDNISFENN